MFLLFCETYLYPLLERLLYIVESLCALNFVLSAEGISELFCCEVSEFYCCVPHVGSSFVYADNLAEVYVLKTAGDDDVFAADCAQFKSVVQFHNLDFRL